MDINLIFQKKENGVVIKILSNFAKKNQMTTVSRKRIVNEIKRFEETNKVNLDDPWAAPYDHDIML